MDKHYNATGPDVNYPLGCIPADVLMEAMPKVSGQAFALYAALVVHCGPKDHCWPSPKKLADRLRTSVRTVQRLAGELAKGGLVERVSRGAHGTHYVLPHLEKAARERDREEVEGKARLRKELRSHRAKSVAVAENGSDSGPLRQICRGTAPNLSHRSIEGRLERVSPSKGELSQAEKDEDPVPAHPVGPVPDLLPTDATEAEAEDGKADGSGELHHPPADTLYNPSAVQEPPRRLRTADDPEQTKRESLFAGEALGRGLRGDAAREYVETRMSEAEEAAKVKRTPLVSASAGSPTVSVRAEAVAVA